MNALNKLFKVAIAIIMLLLTILAVLFKALLGLNSDSEKNESNELDNEPPMHDFDGSQQLGEHALRYDEDGNRIC